MRPLGRALAVLPFLGAGCTRQPPPASPPEVSVTAVVQRDVPITSEWIGTLDGSVNADIRPKVEGYLLRQLYKEGQFVRSGEPLFEIDPRQFRAALDQAQGALGQAEAQLAKASKDVERFTPLVAQRADQPAGAGQRPLRRAERRRRRWPRPARRWSRRA